MVLWQEEAYTRTDENGSPVSFVSLGRSEKIMSILIWTLTVFLQEAYKERERRVGRKWKFMSRSDAQLYSVTGSDPSTYFRSFIFPDRMAGLDSF